MPTLTVKGATALENGYFDVIAYLDGEYCEFRVRDDAELDSQALALFLYRDKQEKTLITLGDRVFSIPGPPPPPTQEQLNLEAWLTLLKTYRETKAKFTFGDGKTTDADVTAAHNALKATYLDSYAPYLVGVF